MKRPVIDLSDARGVGRLAAFAAFLQAAILIFFIAGTHNWLGGNVHAVTTDYASFYAAGRLADDGHAALAYDHDAHLRAEEAATEPGIKYQYFFNPPPFLLLTAPFALLPYLPSFYLFQALTLCLWLAVGTRIAGGGRTVTLCLLAVPSLWWVLGLGQTSFLTASLMGGACLLLPRRKALAGILFGCLCYKPHLAMLVPVALLAAREWRAFVAAGMTVLAIGVLTTLLYGLPVWTAFLHMAQGSVSGAMDNGRVLFAGRIDPTGAAQAAGVGLHAARLLWLVCLACAAGLVALVWRGGSANLRAAALAACTPLAVPFALLYDLILCALAACWLVREARETSFRPGERGALAGLLLLDLLAAPKLVDAWHIPAGAAIAPVLLVLIGRRVAAGRNIARLSCFLRNASRRVIDQQEFDTHSG